MESKKVRRWRITLKTMAWLYTASALMSLVLIGNVLVTREVAVSGYIWNCVTIAVDSTLLALIFGKIKVTE